jgi:dTDP-4-amino-4,6-dideoxygalactose transaminase
MKKIPIFNLKADYFSFKKEFLTEIEEVLESGQYLFGKQLKKFEKNFAKFTQAKFCLGLASGTDAIRLGLLALGIKPGDEVILPANSYPTVFPIVATGATPRLVDVDYDSVNINPEELKKAINSKTKAIIAVHLYGLPASIEKIKKICQEHNLFLIEDCAQAHGAKIRQKHVGTFGDIGCFSFYPTKNLGCFGDGGAIITNNQKHYEKLKMIRMYGEKVRYQSQVPSTHSRLSELQAAVLNVKLKHFRFLFRKRQKLASLYRKLLPLNILIPSKLSKDLTHAFHLFVIKVKNRDKLQERLKKNKIQTLIHYPKPIYRLEAFKYLNKNFKNFKQSEKLSREILSLPFHPNLKTSEIKVICKLITDFIQ